MKVNDGFEIFEARVCREMIALCVPDHPVIFFKQLKNATQAQFVPIKVDNFEDQLKYRWAKIIQQEVQKWQSENNEEIKDPMVFEFFVYKPCQ